MTQSSTIRNQTALIHPSNCSLFVSNQAKLQCNIARAIKRRAHERARKKNNLNVPKNRKNTYQHILIKNLESPSRLHSVRSWRKNKRTERESEGKIVHMFGRCTENKLYSSIHLTFLLALSLACYIVSPLKLCGAYSVVFMMLILQLKQFLLDACIFWCFIAKS